MVRNSNQTLIPLDGSVKVEYTRGGSVAANDIVYFGKWYLEAGHPECNTKGLCIVVIF